MKKIVLMIFFVVCTLCTVQLQADGIAVFQPGYWFDFPENTANSKVDGLKLGLPICSGQGSVDGVELSFFCSATDKIGGLQWSLIGVNSCKELHGTQLGLFNVSTGNTEGEQVGLVNITDHLAGLQLGIVNSAKHGLQLGLININDDGWLPVFILFNFSVK